VASRADDDGDDRQEGYSPGYVRAASRILEHIEHNGLAPGDRLPTERELAAAIGFSHTVTREAIKVLSAVGRVSAQKGRGIYVAAEPAMLGGDEVAHYMPLDLADITALFECRRTLEAQLAELAAERATPGETQVIKDKVDAYRVALDREEFDAGSAADTAFHHAVAVAAHNKFLLAALTTTQRLQQQSAFIGLQHTIDRQHHDAAKEHQAIYDAISRGDGPAARTAAIAHIDRSLEDIHKEIQRRVFG